MSPKSKFCHYVCREFQNLRVIKHRCLGFFILTLSFAVFFSSCEKTETGDSGIARGTIKNETGQPLADVLVKINTVPEQKATTGADGTYMFKDLPVKIYTVSVSITGYTSGTQDVVVFGRTKTLDFTLIKIPILAVSQSNLFFNSNGSSGSASIGITSTVTWLVTSNQTWCRVSVSGGSNNGVVNVACDVNQTSFQRSATITLSAEGVTSRIVIVNQKGKYDLPFILDGDHMLLGNPSGAIASYLMPDNYLMIKPQYVLSYNNTKRIPNWTSWYSGTEWLGSVSRQDDFRPDPELPSGWYAVTANEYSYSGFDRGHVCPSGDRTDQVSSNSATFYMTNMIPQAPKNNQVTWANLESYCRTLITSGNSELYIISGGSGQGGEGSSGFKNTVGNDVVVPAQTWKIIVVLPNGTDDLSRIDNTIRVIAVIMPNKQSCSNYPWTYYRTTVDSIEAVTGYNFLSNISTTIQNVLEAKVDNQ